MKNFDIFLVFAKDINCGYNLEPPRFYVKVEIDFYIQNRYDTQNAYIHVKGVLDEEVLFYTLQ